MRNYFPSDTEAGDASSTWSSFEVWKTTIHDTRAAAGRRAGQSWADYMDELEDQQLLKRRQLQRRVTKVLLAVASVVIVCLMLR